MNSNNLEKLREKVLSSFKEKKFKEVIVDGENLLKERQNDAQLLFLLGLASINLQKFVNAENYFEQLILFKKTAENFYTLGNIQKKIKKYKDAISSFETAIELNPEFSEAHNNLGNTKKLINEREAAITHYKKAINIKKDNIAALINLSTILKEINNYQELIKIYEKILLLDKKNIKTIYNLGTAHLFLGNTSKARECFENVIKIDKHHIPSFRNYVSITVIDKTNKIFNIFKNIELSNLDFQNKTLILDALSKCYFDLDETDLAFDYLNKTNSLKKKQSKFSMKKQKRLFENIKNIFAETYNENFEFENKIKNTPIFIIGMPRSGTSLLEQILSSHSKIYGAGELNYLQKIIDKIGLEIPSDPSKYFLEIRKYYSDEIHKISNSHFIIDKLPSNFRWVGFILKSFPEAKIIHIKRNPMAVCWSNYKNFFIDTGLDFNLTQKDVSIYYSMYSNLMDFWSLRFKNHIFDIQYENFVKNFEADTRKILNYLNLQWEDQLLQYQKTNRPVTTASHQQVREKIKKNTSEEWKKYKNYLKPMQEVLKNMKIQY